MGSRKRLTDLEALFDKGLRSTLFLFPQFQPQPTFNPDGDHVVEVRVQKSRLQRPHWER